MPPAQCEQVLTGAPGFWSPTQPLTAVLGQFLSHPHPKAACLHLGLPVAYKSCTGEQKVEHWQARSDAWTSFCPLGDGRQTDRSTPWLSVSQALLKG